MIPSIIHIMTGEDCHHFIPNHSLPLENVYVTNYHNLKIKSQFNCTVFKWTLSPLRQYTNRNDIINQLICIAYSHVGGQNEVTQLQNNAKISIRNRILSITHISCDILFFSQLK